MGESRWISLLLALWPVPGAFAQCETAKLRPSDLVSHDEFGDSVDVDGDVIVASRPRDGDLGTFSGSAQVFRYDPARWRWIEEAKLLASDGELLDRFGDAVAVDNRDVVVGASGDDDGGVDAGAAYIFRYSTVLDRWVQQAKLVPGDLSGEAGFGGAVDIEGGRVAVSAALQDVNGARSGAVYLYRRNIFIGSWDFETRLVPLDGMVDDRFGSALSLDGDAILVGAVGVDDNGDGAGAAYVFRREPDTSTWVQEAKLLPSHGDAGDLVGAANVAMMGDLAVLGAPNHDHDDGTYGAVFVFRRDPDTSTWQEVGEIFSPMRPGSYFGQTVALGGDLVLVGDGFGGYASVFRDAGAGVPWDVVGEFEAYYGTAGRFGELLALDGTTAAAAVRRDAEGGIDAGAVFVIDVAGEPGPARTPPDMNRDCAVDTFDLVYLLSQWGPCDPEACIADLDGSGTVDVADLIVLLSGWTG